MHAFSEHTGSFASYEKARNWMRREMRRTTKLGWDYAFWIVRMR
jgi:hypothetical protein